MTKWCNGRISTITSLKLMVSPDELMVVYFKHRGAFILNMPVRVHDHVIMARSASQSWLVKVEPGKDFHSQFGIIKHDAIIGREFGETCVSSSNVEFCIVKPLLHELATRFARKTQILYPKDIGFLIINAGILPGSRVLEAGTGSGANTMLLAAVAGGREPGKVVSYDIVEKHRDVARRNLERVGLAGVVDLRLGDVEDPATRERLLGEPPFDVAFFDLPSPWNVVELAWAVLAPCGVFCSFSPVLEQVKKVHATLRAGKWFGVEAVDLQLRAWQVRENATRPASHGRHTGYLVFARKTLDAPPAEWTRKSRKELARHLGIDGATGDGLDALDGGIDWDDGGE